MDDIKEPLDETDEGPAFEDGAEGPAVEERAGKVVNRQKLIAAVTEKTGLPRGKALSAIDAVFDAVSHSLKDGKEVRVLNFGVFLISEREAGKGRDPRTGAEIDVPQTRSVRFRASKALRDMVAETVV